MNMVNNTTEMIGENVTSAANTAAESAGVVGEVWLVIGIISTFLLVLFVAWVFATPIGKESFGRWLRKKKFHKGGYTNALIFTKDGLAKEVFKKNIDNKFTYNDNPYIRVPKLSFPYKGIPTLFYVEGSSAPIDIMDRDPNNLLSCNELDITMNHQLNFDFKEWFNKNKVYIMLGFVIIIGMLAASVYLNYTLFEWVRDSAPAMKESVQNIASSKVT